MDNKPAPKFGDAQFGAAIAVKFKVNTRSSRIRKVDRDGTVHVDLGIVDSSDLDQVLKHFFAAQLGIPQTQVEVMGSGQNDNRLVIFTGVTAEQIDQKIKKRRK